MVTVGDLSDKHLCVSALPRGGSVKLGHLVASWLRSHSFDEREPWVGNSESRQRWWKESIDVDGRQCSKPL